LGKNIKLGEWKLSLVENKIGFIFELNKQNTPKDFKSMGVILYII
jgi:hypothetical protein